MMRSEIKTKNLILRKYEADFAPLLYEAAIESQGGEFSRWMPWCHSDYKIEESLEFIERVEQSWSEGNIWKNGIELGYAIFDSNTGKFLGGIGLNCPNENHKMINLGYWVRTSAQSRGTASKATRALAKAAFEDLPEINRIEILSAVENIPSQKVAEKSGATREAVLRSYLHIGGRIHDAVVFSFIREDFQNE